jgi:chromosome segregation ATPase
MDKKANTATIVVPDSLQSICVATMQAELSRVATLQANVATLAKQLADEKKQRTELDVQLTAALEKIDVLRSEYRSLQLQLRMDAMSRVNFNDDDDSVNLAVLRATWNNQLSRGDMSSYMRPRRRAGS